MGLFQQPARPRLHRRLMQAALTQDALAQRKSLWLADYLVSSESSLNKQPSDLAPAKKPPRAVFHVHGVSKTYRVREVEVHALRGVQAVLAEQEKELTVDDVFRDRAERGTSTIDFLDQEYGEALRGGGKKSPRLSTRTANKARNRIL